MPASESGLSRVELALPRQNGRQRRTSAGLGVEIGKTLAVNLTRDQGRPTATCGLPRAGSGAGYWNVLAGTYRPLAVGATLGCEDQF
jgi:hypothetical protein